MELYAEKGEPKYERAALKYLRRYVDEAGPSLADVAQVAALLAERSLLMRGLQDDRLPAATSLNEEGPPGTPAMTRA